ncbi:mobilome CxxCx(11)CxxC protein [Bradyrhizobium sp. BWA-3-5]|uniref:mobilome CxxCx(11)CxxC protein n=1 Tax=Bradyrhizobium sp. BWA-3-5 TaxID=3080013 RepID=UPI00293E8B17|nr:mobilome CxxCx(11)CxxC protein [Bradyrhizobium sp. BWA-3-5]WOH63606.1 hypothetical protein RX331_23095 [Bradyrhizobium sp. BWA-3-5]
MDDLKRRSNAWDNALHAEGTRAVFERRATRLRWKTRIRDFAGLAVPILLAYLLGSDVFEPLKPYRSFAVGLLGVAAVLQVLLTAWSLLARWDEELADNVTATRENYLLMLAWTKLGEGGAQDLALEYELLLQREQVAAVRDAAKGITAAEKQFGMRAGLILMKRKCVCGHTPTHPNPPWFPNSKCSVCGGN